MKRREKDMIGVRTWRNSMEVVKVFTKDSMEAVKRSLFNSKEDFLGAAFTFRI
jgi:hypothetical protein